MKKKKKDIFDVINNSAKKNGFGGFEDRTYQRGENKKLEFRIGVLMLLQLYLILWLPVVFFEPESSVTIFLWDILLFAAAVGAPILGILMIRRYYPSLFKKGWLIALGGALLLTIFFYFETYHVEHHGWDGLGYFFYLLASIVLIRILLLAYYWRCFGFKRVACLLPFYLILTAVLIGAGNSF